MNESHKWVTVPYTRYERLRELRVRECRQTVMAKFDKHQDIDTGKFDTDKIKTMNSQLLNDIMDDNEFGYGTRRNYYHEIENPVSYVNDGDRKIAIPKFVPKDDDFDKEEKIVSNVIKCCTIKNTWIPK